MNVHNINTVIAHLQADKEERVTGWLGYSQCFVGIVSRALGDDWRTHELTGERFLEDRLGIGRDNAKRLFLMRNDPEWSSDFWEQMFMLPKHRQTDVLVGVLTSLRDTGTAHWAF